MTVLDKLSDFFQSRRVAYDVMYRGRDFSEQDDIWWLYRRVTTEELERAKQAQAQSDRDPFEYAQRIAFAAAMKK